MAQQFVNPRMSLRDYTDLGFMPKDIPAATIRALIENQKNYFINMLNKTKMWTWPEDDRHPGNRNIGKYGTSVDTFIGIVDRDGEEVVITLTWHQLKTLHEDGFLVSNFICRTDLLLGFTFDNEYFTRLGLHPVAWHIEKYLETEDAIRDGTRVILTTFFNVFDRDNMFWYFNLRWGQGIKEMKANRHWTGAKPPADIYQRSLIKKAVEKTEEKSKKLATMKTTKARKVQESDRTNVIPSEKSKFSALDAAASGTPPPSDDEAEPTTTA